ncbi:uncharacterized protein LAJ45_10736 [Morchella importuna]|uniref:uncharacterized protein n=1 Tax=Morchella importuna TaxID=1174673 RepID=UPI001E8DC00A|nr:uncharacterized protein LAJ45_10736 [Morchella importuna]KAH8145299.1 hypothetical protein LAJ45_10736 [Morchella importuna]
MEMRFSACLTAHTSFPQYIWVAEGRTPLVLTYYCNQRLYQVFTSVPDIRTPPVVAHVLVMGRTLHFWPQSSVYARRSSLSSYLTGRLDPVVFEYN